MQITLVGDKSHSANPRRLGGETKEAKNTHGRRERSSLTLQTYITHSSTKGDFTILQFKFSNQDNRNQFSLRNAQAQTLWVTND